MELSPQKTIEDDKGVKITSTKSGKSFDLAGSACLKVIYDASDVIKSAEHRQFAISL